MQESFDFSQQDELELSEEAKIQREKEDQMKIHFNKLCEHYSMFQKRLLPHREKSFRENEKPLKIYVKNQAGNEDLLKLQRNQVLSKLHLKIKLQNAFKWTTEKFGGEI